MRSTPIPIKGNASVAVKAAIGGTANAIPAPKTRTEAIRAFIE